MKKKKIIISIFLVILLSMSAFVVVQATSGDENSIFEQLKALITGNTDRIEVLENKVGTLENEVETLKEQIAELQKPQEEENTNETENKEVTTNNSNTKPTSNTTTKTPTSSNTATKPTSNNSNNTDNKTTTTDYQKQTDALNKEIATLKENIKNLESQDNKQTNEIENLKTELNNKCEELEKIISNSNNSNNTTITNADLIGTWENGEYKYIFKADGTMSETTSLGGLTSAYNSEDKVQLKVTVCQTNNYKYTLNGNIITLTGINREYQTKIVLINAETKEEINFTKANELMGTNFSTEEEFVKYFDGNNHTYSNYIKENNKTEKINSQNSLRYDYASGQLIMSLGLAVTKTK